MKRSYTNLITSVCQAYMTVHSNKVEFCALLKLTGFFTNENTWEVLLEDVLANKEKVQHHFWSSHALTNRNSLNVNALKQVHC